MTVLFFTGGPGKTASVQPRGTSLNSAAIIFRFVSLFTCRTFIFFDPFSTTRLDDVSFVDIIVQRRQFVKGAHKNESTQWGNIFVWPKISESSIL